MGSMRDRYGDAAALAIARAASDSVEAIGRFCSEQEVDAWFRHSGYLQVSAAPAQDGVWEPARRACRELGEPDAVRELSAAEVAERCRSPRFRGGAFYPGAATVQPARLALGLRDRVAACEHVDVFETSPLRRLQRGPVGLRRRDAGRADPGRARACSRSGPPSPRPARRCAGG